MKGITTHQLLKQQSSLASSSSSTIPNSSKKKKRSLPGNPDPESEVVALSPKTLMATNRFVCEICSKGFQRDQNLQLHRRGHNLPWKLKQQPKEVIIRKKVYVCPEPTCVHHDPSRALGDLTGVKKHFSRKHGEKRWKCDKCSKKYAVHSDWKAHSKICGAREYRCDCGTLFSRKDSFITHRAFCDALAVEESSRDISSNTMAAAHHGGCFSLQLHSNQQVQQMNKELGTVLPPWLKYCQGSTSSNSLSHLDYLSDQHEYPNHGSLPPPPPPPLPLNFTVTAPHMSATALLQKAAQMGATLSTGRPDQMAPLLLTSPPPHHLEDMMMMNNNPLSSSTNPGFDGPFEDAFGGIMGSKREGNSYMEGMVRTQGSNDGMTRDFLGLRAFFPQGYS